MCAVVQIFRRLPTKNDAVLQVYVKRQFSKELLQLHTAVQMAMIDLKEPVHLTDADFTVVQDTVSSLEPVKLAVTALCRRAMTPVTAETALNFYLVQLRKQSSEIAKTLASAIEEQLSERRALHTGILAYLHGTSARSTATVFTSIKRSHQEVHTSAVHSSQHSEHTGRITCCCGRSR